MCEYLQEAETLFKRIKDRFPTLCIIAMENQRPWIVEDIRGVLKAVAIEVQAQEVKVACGKESEMPTSHEQAEVSWGEALAALQEATEAWQQASEALRKATLREAVAAMREAKARWSESRRGNKGGTR